MTLRLTRTCRCAALLAATIMVAGCGSTAPTSPTSGSPTAASAAPDSDAFAQSMAYPIDLWRTSFQTGPMTFTVPGTVLAASVGHGPVQLVASGDAVAGVRPAAISDAFHIGSMTKLFTAALMMQLDQEGVLSLDSTINTWFPTAPNGSKITVRLLLEHESGLNEIDFDLIGKATSQQLIDNVFARPPIAQPGAEYQYLNAGYLILGRIAEKATGMPYAHLVQARFIGPFGLTSTYLDGYGDGPEAVNGYDLACAGATGSDCLGKPSTPQAVTTSPQWKGAWSAGGMVSTARDQAIWLRALVDGDVLDEAHKQLMRNLTPLSTAYYSAAYAHAGISPLQLGEGAGLATWAVPGVGNCLGHAGAIPGSNGIAAYCPDHDLAIVILNNVNPAGTAPGYPGLFQLTPTALRIIGR